MNHEAAENALFERVIWVGPVGGGLQRGVIVEMDYQVAESYKVLVLFDLGNTEKLVDIKDLVLWTPELEIWIQSNSLMFHRNQMFYSVDKGGKSLSVKTWNKPTRDLHERVARTIELLNERSVGEA
jgi:hypothetical protein